MLIMCIRRTNEKSKCDEIKSDDADLHDDINFIWKYSICGRFTGIASDRGYKIFYTSSLSESGYYGYNSTSETIHNGIFTVNSLDPGTRYDVKIEVSHHDKAFFYFTPTIIVATAPSSDNLTIKQIKATETSASFIVRGAGGIVNEYIIRYYPKDDINSAIEQTFYSKENEIENEYTLEGLKPDKEYTVEITPCFRVNFIDPTVTDSEQSFLAKGTSKKFSIKQIPLMAVENLYQSKKDKNYIKVQWEPNTIADGYQVSLLDGESGNVVKSV